MKATRFYIIWTLVTSASVLVYTRMSSEKSPNSNFGKIEESKGAVQILPPSISVWQGANSGDSLEAGSLVSTGPHSSALVTLTTGERVHIAEQTQISLQSSRENQNGSFVNILQGSVRLDTPPKVKSNQHKSGFKIAAFVANITSRVQEVMNTPKQTSLVAADKIVNVSAPESAVEINVNANAEAEISVKAGEAKVESQTLADNVVVATPSPTPVTVENPSLPQTGALSTPTPTPTPTPEPTPEPATPSYVLSNPAVGTKFWDTENATNRRNITLKFISTPPKGPVATPSKIYAAIHSSQRISPERLPAFHDGNTVSVDLTNHVMRTLCPTENAVCSVRFVLKCTMPIMDEECSATAELQFEKVRIEKNKSYLIHLSDFGEPYDGISSWKKVPQLNGPDKSESIVSGEWLLSAAQYYLPDSLAPIEQTFAESAYKTFSRGQFPTLQFLEEPKAKPTWLNSIFAESNLVEFAGGTASMLPANTISQACPSGGKSAIFARSGKSIELSCAQLSLAPESLAWLKTQNWIQFTSASGAVLKNPSHNRPPTANLTSPSPLPTIAYFSAQKPSAASPSESEKLRTFLPWLPEVPNKSIKTTFTLNKSLLKNAWDEKLMWKSIQSMPFPIALTLSSTSAPSAWMYVKSWNAPREVKSALEAESLLGFHGVAKQIPGTKLLIAKGNDKRFFENARGVLYARKNFAKSPNDIPIGLVRSLGKKNGEIFLELYVSTEADTVPESYIWMVEP